jgi:hypothetical protein
LIEKQIAESGLTSIQNAAETLPVLVVLMIDTSEPIIDQKHMPKLCPKFTDH